MTDDQLTDSDVALLCDIGGGSASFNEAKTARIGALIDRGLIERDSKEPGLRLKLTAWAQELLAARGVGINES